MSRRSKTGVRGLYRRHDGRYRLDLRWTDAKGQPHRATELMPAGATLAAAKEDARLLLNSALAGTYHPNRDGHPRLRAALDDYLAWRAANKRAAVDASERQAGYLVKVLGDVDLVTLRAEDVERYKSRRIAVVKPATVNRELALFKHFVRWTCQRGWLDEGQAERLHHVPLLKEPPGRVRYLSPDEEGRLMAAAVTTPRMQRIILAALLTGMRQGEIIGLRREAVDLAAGEITLIKTKSNRVRRLPIAAALMGTLEKALAASQSGFVFESRRGEPYTETGLRTSWERVRERAGLEDFHFHDLRHSCATALRRRGAGLDVIAKILGHSSLAMVTRYAHVGDELMRSAIAALPPIVAAPLPHTPKLRLVKQR